MAEVYTAPSRYAWLRSPQAKQVIAEWVASQGVRPGADDAAGSTPAKKTPEAVKATAPDEGLSTTTLLIGGAVAVLAALWYFSRR